MCIPSNVHRSVLINMSRCTEINLKVISYLVFLVGGPACTAAAAGVVVLVERGDGGARGEGRGVGGFCGSSIMNHLHLNELSLLTQKEDDIKWKKVQQK